MEHRTYYEQKLMEKDLEKCRCQESKHKNVCLVALILFPLIFVSLGFYMFYIVPLDNNILYADGYKIEVSAGVHTLNRYTFFSDPESVPSPSFASSPRSSQVVTYDYLDTFESGSESWTESNLGMVWIGSKKYVYQGVKSYVFYANPSTGGYTYKNVTLHADWNETHDVNYYTYAEKTPTNGYYGFQMQVEWSDGVGDRNATLTFLMFNVGSTYTSTNPRETIVKMNDPITSKYCGYMIKSVRNYITSFDTTATDMPYNITQLKYFIKDGVLPRAFLDYINIKKLPHQPYGQWYREGTPVTDYQMTINYSIYVDSNTITNLSSVQLTVDLYEQFSTELSSAFPEFIAESVILGDFMFGDTLFNIYNKVTTGSYTGILHMFPERDYWGQNMTYTFRAEMSGYALKMDNTPSSDSTNKTLTGFTINYMNPIHVV